jgi:hypothetical protein
MGNPFRVGEDVHLDDLPVVIVKAPTKNGLPSRIATRSRSIDP